MSDPAFSFEALVNKPDCQFRMWTKKSRTIDDEKGIHLVDSTTKVPRPLPISPSDDPFPNLSSEHIITAIYKRNCPVPVFSTTHDVGWCLYSAFMQFGKGIIELDDTVRITVTQTTSPSGAQLLDVRAVDILQAMSDYKKPDSWMYSTAMSFANASSQHLHCDIGSEFILWSHEFTLPVSISFRKMR